MNAAGDTKKQRLHEEGILEAARTLIEAQGAHSFSIRSLSKALGVSPMALYRHTGDRATLLGSVLDRVLIEQEKRSGAKMSDHTFGDLARAYGDVAMSNPQVFIAFISEQGAKSAAAETWSQHMLDALLRIGRNIEDAALIRDIVVDHAHGHLLASAAQKNQAVLDRLREGYTAASRLLIERLMA